MNKRKTLYAIIGGVFAGGLLLFLYMLRFQTYLGDDPSACMNCHIMEPNYATWMHSSHGRDGVATCNDCHVPHQNFAKKYFFKGKDGMRHVAMFVTESETQAIMANMASKEVIMANCVRCHEQLTTEFVKIGRTESMIGKANEHACWECHRDVPHHGMNSLSATPNALVPHPESPVPEWLKKLTDNNK